MYVLLWHICMPIILSLPSHTFIWGSISFKAQNNSPLTNTHAHSAVLVTGFSATSQLLLKRSQLNYKEDC